MIYPGCPNTSRGMPVAISCAGEMLAYPSSCYVVITHLGTHHSTFFKQHKDSVRCTRFSPDGSLLASGDNSGNIYVYDPNTLKLKASFQHCMQAINDLSFHNDHVLAVGAGVPFARLLNIAKEKVEAGLGSLGKTACGGCIVEDRVFIGGEQNEVKFYKAGKFQKSDKRFHGYVNCLRHNPSKTRIAACSTDRILRVYTADFEDAWEVNKAHEGGIMQLAWLDDQTLCTASNDKSLKLWKEGILISTIRTKDTPTLNDFQVGVDVSEGKIVSVSLDGTINLIHPKDGVLAAWQGHNSRIVAIHCSAGLMVTAEENGKVLAWKRGVPHSAVPFQNDGKLQMLSGLFRSPSHFLAVQLSGTVLALHTQSLKVLDKYSTKLVHGISAHLEGECLLIAVQADVHLVEKNDSLATFKADKQVTALSSMQEGRKWVCGTLSGVVILVDGEEKQSQHKLSQHKISALHRAGDILAVGDSNGSIFICSAAAQEIHRNFSHHASITGLVVCPQHGLLVSGGLDKRVLVWDIKKKQKVREEKDTHMGGMIKISVSEGIVISGGSDGMICQYKL